MASGRSPGSSISRCRSAGNFERCRSAPPANAVVVRLGGDEFLLMVDATDAAALSRLETALRADPLQAPAEFTVGCAVRVGDEALEATLRRADAALYATRAAARGGGADLKR